VKRDPGRAVQSEVGAVHGDEGLAEIAQAGFSGAVERRFGQDHQHASARGLAEAVKAERIVAQAPGRLASRFLAHFDLGHEVAQRRIGAGELDAGGLAHQAAAAVTADQIVCAQGLAVGERQVDAGLVLREARHLQVSIDRHSELFDPAGQDALDMALPQCEPVSVPGGKVADVERGPGEAGELGDLAFAQETIRDAALVENLDAARVQAAGARADQFLIGAPFDHCDVDMRERELRGQHQAGRATAGDHDGVVFRAVSHMVLCVMGAGPFAVAARPGRRKQYRHVMTPRVWMVFGSRVLRQGRGLEASPLHTTYLSGEREILCSHSAR
jgi:hypothetical protein